MANRVYRRPTSLFPTLSLSLDLITLQGATGAASTVPGPTGPTGDE